jgi:protein-tyrosine-phosphatase
MRARTVLFVCVHNAGRSQMAAAFLERLAGADLRVLSAGSEPAHELNARAVEAMREVGIDMAQRLPALLDPESVGSADVVITMGCGDACPVFPGKVYRDWELDDPADRPLEEVRVIRDEIERRVRLLADELLGSPRR